jgi:FixJ family two-component response regulator
MTAQAALALPTAIMEACMSENPLIAVIDDDASIRGALQRLLRSVGLRTAAFASAEEFLQAGQL